MIRKYVYFLCRFRHCFFFCVCIICVGLSQVVMSLETKAGLSFKSSKFAALTLCNELSLSHTHARTLIITLDILRYLEDDPFSIG